MKNEAVAWMLEKMDKGLYFHKQGKLFHASGKEVGSKDSDGYRVGSVRNKGVRKQYKVHRVLFAYYHGIDELGRHEVINHKDFNRTNNVKENLEGISSRENVMYSKLNGRYAIKLTNKDVLEIRGLIEEGKPMIEIGNIFGVVETTISAIKHGYSWNHIQLEKEVN